MSSKKTLKSVLAAAGVLAGIIAAAAATNLPTHEEATPETPTAPTSATAPAPLDADQAAASAAAVVVAQELPIIDPDEVVPAYQRDSFGADWADIDGNGCRQRDDVLARDLTDVVLDSNGCTVLSGILENDPYTGQDIVFQHDRIAEEGNPGSQGVQGEHIVSLKAAHLGGAWAWDDARRLQFANTLDNVIAVDGLANQSKQDAGPADWLPDTSYRCTYAIKYTQIVDTWDLAVTAADRDALVGTLSACAGE